MIDTTTIREKKWRLECSETDKIFFDASKLFYELLDEIDMLRSQLKAANSLYLQSCMRADAIEKERRLLFSEKLINDLAEEHHTCPK